MIEVSDLHKSFDQNHVLKGVNLKISDGKSKVIIGASGQGKSVILKCLLGLIKPDTGNVFLHQNNITKVPMYKRSKMGIGYLPQEVSVFRKLSVEDNIKAILEMSSLSKKEQKINLFLE